MAVLKIKGTARRKQLSIRIPSELSERIDVVRALARERRMVFELGEQLEPAIEKIVKQAERELGIKSKSDSDDGGTT